jgi:hypothetical protein
MNLRQLADHLGRVDLAAVGANALADQAAVLANAVREALSNPPGGSHEYPWLRTGALRDSIATDIGPTDAFIGSTSDVALYQETGTVSVPPRPFLAPVAASRADDVAGAIGLAVFQALDARG